MPIPILPLQQYMCTTQMFPHPFDLPTTVVLFQALLLIKNLFSLHELNPKSSRLQECVFFSIMNLIMPWVSVRESSRYAKKINPPYWVLLDTEMPLL
jgi:hypothetical protein